jgi:HPt (histidine-containing phosphotransfer) domain-containing protein
MRKRIMDREILESVGIDYAEAEERFSGSTELFEKFLEEMATMNVIAALQKALTAGDAINAFRVAHTLKGNFGNLSIKPLYNVITPLVEAVRSENMLEAQKLYIELEKEYEAVTEGIRKAIK